MSLNSSQGSSLNPDNICANLAGKDRKWRALDAKLGTYIDEIDSLHKNGQGNSPDCIQLSIERKECEDQIKLLEDEITRLGLAPMLAALSTKKGKAAIRIVNLKLFLQERQKKLWITLKYL
ncbi:hypothetical protein AVEN_216227-1 [Araneus ventricosus]|uniref:Uncharacterized protein n=1 Tax=Araneus ventricosus TaxID=182803 RepID=A0A4Y2VAF8_ARAVE|nr:hypothetical protein AVEN_259958-1 [Araneus ventricosus]GBO22255.1 hypothetical protein AVEN_21830-1 [Araneus ventricosus]GBO22259.1 hypothetical protein AVEN_198599-1 [Araneus ventricosus]GBO22264.1 hypothetical protein AVEN_216227-1 [Araneus ventricosus]